MGAVLDAHPRVVRVAGAAGQQLGREGARRLALAGAGRAVQQVRVRGPAVRPERGAEHGGGVRMGFEGEHARGL